MLQVTRLFKQTSKVGAVDGRAMASTAPAAGALRDQLKVALTDAKCMFDEGLVDQHEYGELKAHELRKYKHALASLNAVAGSDAAPRTPPPRGPHQHRDNHSDVPSGRPGRHGSSTLTTSEAALAVANAWGSGDATVLSTPDRCPALPRNQRYDEPETGSASAAAAAVSAVASAQLLDSDSILGDPDVYERLRTPPIFRRRSATARRTVVLSGTEVQKLRQDEEH
jgi:hypothetical protein